MESNESVTANGQEPRPALSTNGSSGPRDSKGWDGKLRVDKKAVLANPEALSDPDYSDGDAPPVEQIDADEGRWACHPCFGIFTKGIRQIYSRSMNLILRYELYTLPLVEPH